MGEPLSGAGIMLPVMTPAQSTSSQQSDMYESVFLSYPIEPMIAHGREGVGAQVVLGSEMHILQGVAARLGSG
jgi:hypothetical protein